MPFCHIFNIPSHMLMISIKFFINIHPEGKKLPYRLTGLGYLPLSPWIMGSSHTIMMIRFLHINMNQNWLTQWSGRRVIKPFNHNEAKTRTQQSDKPGFQLIKVTKGQNSAKNVWIAIHRKYAPGHLMTKLLWKFGQYPLKNVGVAYRRNCFRLSTSPTTYIPQSNNKIFPAENLVRI